MLTVTPDPLIQGGTARVCVSGSSKPAGTKITVMIDDGEEQTSSVEIVLDGAGAGCADWTVLSWELANFNYSSCSEESRDIGPAAPPPP